MSQQLENGAMDKVMSALKEPDRFLEDTFASARAGADRCVADATSYVRTEPVKAIATAAVAGFAMRILPMRRIVNTFLYVALALLKPAVLIYGGAKVWQKMHGCPASDGNGEPEQNEDRAKNSQNGGGAGSGN